MLKIKEFLQKNKHELRCLIKIFLLVFIFNIVLLFCVNILSNGMVNDTIYNADSMRAFDDLTNFRGNHYRTRVHPLFVIFTQPFVQILKFLLSSPNATIIFQAFIGALCVILLYLNLKKLNVNKFNLNLALALFVLSFSQVVFISIFETYIYAEFGLLLMWLVGQYLIDKKLNYIDILLLIGLGVIAISITITNYFQFIILLSFITIFNKNLKHRILVFFSVIFLSSSVAVMIACLQNVIWPSANNFFTASIDGFILHKNSEEFLYIDKTFSIRNVLMQIKASTVFQFSLLGDFNSTQFNFYSNIIINTIACLLFGGLIAVNAIFILQNRKRILKHKFYLSILLAYLFNFILHIFYGPSESFLYTLNYIYLPLIMIFYIVNNIEKTHMNLIKKCKYPIYTLIAIILIAQIIGVIRYLVSIFMIFGFNHVIPKKLFVIAVMAVILLIFVCVKKKIFAIIGALVFTLLAILGVKAINTSLSSRPIRNEEMLIAAKSDYKNFLNSKKNIELISSLANYYYELNINLNREHFYLGKFEKTNKQYSNFFYFGMVDRDKLLYKDGKIIDVRSKKIIRELPHKYEVIIPNEYTVLLADEKNNITRIYEDENGVFLENNEKTETLTKGKQKFNLPRFEGRKYANILRVLNQEILFNFDGILLKPNIISYKNSNNVWYRDTMLATMVLENTNNTHLLEPWIKTITGIYDCQRSLINNDHSCGIKEADNPGELLYMLGAIKNNRSDLINKIIEEVKKKAKNGLFTGIVDGEEMSFYPTSLLLFGAKKNNIDLSRYLKTPKTPDHYASLTWWDKDTPRQNLPVIESRIFSYLEWASTHYKNGNYGKVNVLDEYYPLSYEAGLNQAIADDQKFVSEHYSVLEGPILTHVWHASEMFLLLMELN